MNTYEFVKEQACTVGKFIHEEREKGFSISEKDGNFRDIVTSIDERANNMLLEAIRNTFPEDAIYSEEGGNSAKSTRQWVLDPIDGTSNFSRGIPHYAVSIGLVEGQVPIVGAVYNPNTGELFSFEKGKGAFLNDTPIHVSVLTDFSRAQVVIGFGSRKPELWDWAAVSYRKLIEYTWKRSMLGSSALDICYIACGRADVGVYGTLSTLDIAAAIGILYEAGGVIENSQGDTISLSSEPQKAYLGNGKGLVNNIRTLLET